MCCLLIEYEIRIISQQSLNLRCEGSQGVVAVVNGINCIIYLESGTLVIDEVTVEGYDGSGSLMYLPI